jgi:hypothetical protein
VSSASDSAAPPAGTARPVITVSKGRATPAELAAVLAVLTAYSAQAAAAAAAHPAAGSLWAERSRDWFTLPRPGPRSWRASALPR